MRNVVNTCITCHNTFTFSPIFINCNQNFLYQFTRKPTKHELNLQLKHYFIEYILEKWMMKSKEIVFN